jgi:hypothetical protein
MQVKIKGSAFQRQHKVSNTITSTVHIITPPSSAICALHFHHLSLSISCSLSDAENEAPLYHLPLSPCLMRSVVPRSQHNEDPGQAPGVLHLQPLPERHTPRRRDQPSAHHNGSGREQWRHGTFACTRALVADNAPRALSPCFG